jgi:superfamily II DNA or RNA helicase
MGDRSYQTEAVDSVFSQWESGVRSTAVILPTGSGKSRVMSMIAERLLPKRCILLAHRSELIYQARLAFLARGIDCDIEKAELRASVNLFTQAPVVLAMVQTLGSGGIDKKRMKSLDPMQFDALLYDEFHHAAADGNKAIVDYFLNGNPNLKVAGFTACPKRADDLALGVVCESVAYNKDIEWGVDEGWLVEPRQLMVHCGSLDFSHIHTTAGDLNSTELAAVMEQEEPCQKIKQAVLESAFDVEQGELIKYHPSEWGKILLERREPRRSIVFTTSVKQAEILSGIFNRVLPGISNFVHGKTKDYDREHMLKSFKDGGTAIMVNCDVLTEGYDNPYAEIIALGRPTKSLGKYIQWIGRGTRPIPGVIDSCETKEERKLAIANSVKPYCTILDLHANAGRHKLVKLVDVLGGVISDDVRTRVVERITKEKTAMQIKEVVEEEAERLRQEIEAKRLAKEAERARLLAKVEYSTTQVNPFDKFDTAPSRVQAQKSLSNDQLKMLISQKQYRPGMSYAEGSSIFREIMRRMRGKLASLPQCERIHRIYPEVDTSTLTRARASKILDATAASNWKRVDITKL